MGIVRLSGAAFVCLIAVTVFTKLRTVPPIPTLDPNPWWGPGKPQADNPAIKSFTIKIPEDDVKDLKTRLALPSRYTKALEGSNFKYGLSGEVLDELVKYWSSIYDWRKREQRLNKFPHFITQIEGLDIHFLHVKPKLPSSSKVRVEPLLLIHGWPGSFVEFMDILPLLTTPRDSSDVVFEVIAPSLPGYGFSQASSKQGLSALETTQIFTKLMARLGHDRFYVQGGDWGSLVATNIAILFPEKVKGVHVNMAAGVPPIAHMYTFLGSILPSGWILPKSDEHKLYPVSSLFSKILQETGYLHIQASKPDTIGNALNASPVALLAYIMEKFSSWTHFDNVDHPNGGLMDPKFTISRDAMLDNICIYWFGKSIATSQRYYAETLNKRYYSLNMDAIPVLVPAGYAAFPQELLNMPKSLSEYKYTNLVAFKDMPSGGHFAAMEVPHLLADHVFEFVNIVENIKSDKKEL